MSAMKYIKQHHFPWWFWVGLTIVAVEVLSYSGWVYPTINTIVFIVLCIAALLLSFKRLEWGIALLFTELIIGSKGYLFSYTLFGFSVSIRLALFAVVCAASIYWMARQREIALLHWKFFRP